MSRSFFLISVALILLSGGVYLWWNSRPEQQIHRRIDDLFEAVHFKKLSLTKKEHRNELIQRAFAESVTFEGEGYFPDETLSQEQIIERLHQFHALISLCEFEEKERILSLDASEASVQIDTVIKVASGPQYKKSERWTLTIYLKKANAWKAHRITGYRKGSP